MREMDATPPRPRGFVRMHYRDLHLPTVFLIQGCGKILKGKNECTLIILIMATFFEPIAYVSPPFMPEDITVG